MDAVLDTFNHRYLYMYAFDRVASLVAYVGFRGTCIVQPLEAGASGQPRLIVTASSVHDPDTPGGDVGGKVGWYWWQDSSII